MLPLHRQAGPVCIISDGDQSHSNTEEPSPDFPRVYRAVAAARRQLFTGSPSTSTELIQDVTTTQNRRTDQASLSESRLEDTSALSPDTFFYTGELGSSRRSVS
ncbi:hypothetical protein AOLI_G00217670 [Acnodon oligacanthus]